MLRVSVWGPTTVDDTAGQGRFRAAGATNLPRRSHWPTLALTAMLVLASGASALDPARSIRQYTLSSWSLEDGFPQTSANAIVQGGDGYIYVATFGGLVRFDGARVRVVPSDGTCSNRLYSLAVDGAGTIWAGTERAGLCRVRGDVLVGFEMPDKSDIGGVTTIRRVRDGGIWAGSVAGLVHVSERGVDRYDLAAGLPGLFVGALDEAPDGTLWVGTDRGLCLFRQGRCLTPEWAKVFEDRQVEAIGHAAGGVTWVGTRKDLYRVSADEVEHVPLPEGPRRIRTILQDRDGNVWLGMDPGGLWRVAPRFDRLERRATLVGDVVAALFEDREGNLWVGYSGSGLVKLTNGRAIGLRLPSEESSAPVLPILGDGRGGAWVGTACEGLAHVTGDRVRMFGMADGLHNPCVWSLLRDDAAEGLWIGTHGDGLFRMDADGKIEWRGTPPTREGVVRALDRDEDGRILAGTDHGLFRYDPITGAFALVAGTEGADVYFVSQDDDGAVRVGTRTGALIVRQSGVERLDRTTGLSSDSVRAILRDPDGVLWIGTYGGGLNRVERDVVTVYDTRNGLPDSVVSRIIEDPAGRFWMTSNRGVMRAERRQLEALAAGQVAGVSVDLFDVRDGMPVSETNGGAQPAGALLEDGSIWLPTVDGVAVFDTATEIANVLPPPVRIEDIIVDGTRVGRDGEVVIDTAARNLEIHYTALSFRSPERVRFRYRLEGFDDRWVDAGTRRVAYYPVIPSGELTFHVIACNDDGVWNEEGASFSFTLRPRFVETGWFYGLLGLLLGALVALGIWLRGVASERNRRNLELQVDRRPAELAKLAELTEQINQAVTLEEVLDHVYDSLRSVIPYDRVGLALLDEDRIVLRAVWSRSESDHVEIGQGYEAPLQGSSLAKVLESGEPRVISDLVKYLEEHPRSESTRKIVSEGIRSSMTCPLKALGRPVGFIFFSSMKTDTYRESHVRFLRQIAGQLSLVVGKSKIYEDLLETKKRLEEANRNLESLAAADGLTGIANRRTFDARLQEEWRRAIRAKSSLSLLMIDVDSFKAYNDRYGHTVGDDCLRTIATVLAANLRRVADMVARFGGEEFAVILPDTDETSARMMAERLRSGVEALRMRHESSDAAQVVTISLGGATVVPTSDAVVASLIEAADAELYAAKRQGRNRASHRDLDADRVESATTI